MQSNDFLRSSTTPFMESPHLFTNNLQSQLSMLYALAQQQISSSLSPSDSKIKRVKYATMNFFYFKAYFYFSIESQCHYKMNFRLKCQ